MPEISHQTKITVGLAITAFSVVFASGYFYAKQESVMDRVKSLETERDKTTQVSQDVAVIKSQLNALDIKLNAAIVRWDRHIDTK